MKFDKETVIILGTCVVILLAWPFISESMGWSKPAGDKNITATEKKPVPEVPAPAAAAPVKPAVPVIPEVPAVPSAPEKNYTLENDLLALQISGNTGKINRITFRKYQNNAQDGDISIETLSPQGAIFNYIPGADIQQVKCSVHAGNADITIIRDFASVRGNFQLRQRIALDKNYLITSEYTFVNTGKTPAVIPAAVVSGGAMGQWHQLTGDKIRAVAYRMDYLTADGNFKDVDGDDDDEDFYLSSPPEVRWAGVSNKYFCLLLKSGKPFRLWQYRSFVNGSKKAPLIAAGANLPAMTLAPGSQESLSFSAYAGPKITANLNNFAPDANKVMHLAWGPLNYLARFLLWLLKSFYALCGSYGLSIILLTLLVRTVFYPITARGNESMKKMQKVQPKFKELREKYKDNPQLLNQKMAELYREEGVNPFAGCLPILLQIPIFFALYAMLDNVVELRHVSFLWCKNLAAADTVCRIPLFIDFPFIGSSIPVNPLVLAMTALMVIQQRMTPMSVDPAQKKMMAMMPVIMLLFLYDLPSGLTLYWTVSNIFSIIQLWLQKRRGQPKAESTAAGK